MPKHSHTLSIGIVSSGDMGHAVGTALRSHGCRILTYLGGRSRRTHELANKANFTIVDQLEELVAEVDLLMSIVPPAAAEEVAAALIPPLANLGKPPVFVECNAIAPRKVKKIQADISETGAPFIDAAIIGPPPGIGWPSLYVSGPNITPMQMIDDMGFSVLPLGQNVGTASSLKMLFSAVNKGTLALLTEVLIASRRDSLDVHLLAELGARRPQISKWIEDAVPGLAMNSGRWAPEMEEIANYLADLGFAGEYHIGAASTYRRLAKTALADETRDEDGMPRDRR